MEELTPLQIRALYDLLMRDRVGYTAYQSSSKSCLLYGTEICFLFSRLRERNMCIHCTRLEFSRTPNLPNRTRGRPPSAANGNGHKHRQRDAGLAY